LDENAQFEGWNYVQREIFKLPRTKHFETVLSKREEENKVLRDIARKKEIDDLREKKLILK